MSLKNIFNPFTGKLQKIVNTDVLDSKISKNEENIITNAFRIAVLGSYSYFDMVDGIVDYFNDETGIDTGASSNERYNSTFKYYEPEKSTAPIIFYKFEDDIASTNVVDEMDNVAGVASTNTNNLSTTGKINKGFLLNGTNQRVGFSDTSLPSGSAVRTFTFWIKYTVNDANYRSIFNYGQTSGTNIFDVYVRNGYIGFTQFGSNFLTDATYNDGNWHFVAIVFDGTNFSIRVDTTVKSTNTLTINTTLNTTAYLGYRIADGNYLGCSIDNFRAFDVDLTTEQLDYIYNSGNGTDNKYIGEAGVLDMVLQSIAFTADAQPDELRLVVLFEAVDSIILNTDFKAYVSRDNGTTWTQITLAQDGTFDSDRVVLIGTADVSSQPSGTNIKYKFTTHNSKDLRVHANSELWG